MNIPKRILTRLGIYPLTVCALVTSISLNAETAKFQWHGFIAQGALQAENSNFVNDEGDLSLALTEIGINASYQINNRLRSAAQVIYLNGDNRYPEGARIDYLLLDWTLQDSALWKSNLLLGRFKNDHWLYSATRDVPHALPSIILPQSVYFDVFRDAALTLQGVGWRNSILSDSGTYELKLSYGKGPLHEDTAQFTASSRALGELQIERSLLSSFSYSPLSERWTAYASYTDVDSSYTASKRDPFPNATSYLHRYMLGVIYSGSNYEIAGEVFQEKEGVSDFPLFGSDYAFVSQGGYIQYRHFLSDSLSGLLRLDIFDRDKDDRRGRQLEALGIPAYFGFMDDLTAGIQWDISKGWRLQMEYHYVEGTGRLARYEPNLTVNQSKYWDMWAVKLIHWF